MNYQPHTISVIDEECPESVQRTPNSLSVVYRAKTDQSVGSNLGSTDATSNSCESGSKHSTRSYKFRPRFQDEGLEDYHTDGDGGPDRDLDDDDQSVSDDLEECMNAGVLMEKDALKRAGHGEEAACNALLHE